MAADIILLDRNGTPVSYYPPRQIAVEGHGHDGEEVTRKYTRMTSMNCYIVTRVSEGFQVNKQVYNIGSEDYWAIGISENDMLEFGSQDSSGDRAVLLYVTPMSLTVGNIYTNLT